MIIINIIQIVYNFLLGCFFIQLTTSGIKLRQFWWALLFGILAILFMMNVATIAVNIK